MSKDFLLSKLFLFNSSIYNGGQGHYTKKKISNFQLFMKLEIMWLKHQAQDHEYIVGSC